MDLPNAIENEAGNVEVVYRCKFNTVCSITKSPMWGEIVFDYMPDGKLVELCSFDEWVRGLYNKTFTAETLCQFVTKTLLDLIAPAALVVQVHSLSHDHSPVIVLKEEGDTALLSYVSRM